MNRTASTAYIDLLLVTLLGFIAFYVLVAQLNAKAEDQGKPPGTVAVEIEWPDALDADVDLWVLAPGALERPVGYSNRSSVVFDLLRDDLGHYNDPMTANYETAYSRGVPAGEYVVNVHLFGLRGATGAPVPVRVLVTVRTPTGQSVVGVRNVVLDRIGREITVMRFRLNDRGLVTDVSDPPLPKALRSNMGAGLGWQGGMQH